MTDAPPPSFSFGLRVYWEDTDAGGVVFHANYLKFFERARTEWLRARGVEQQRLRLAHGTAFVVTESALRYLQPARLDDWLDISVHVVEARGASLRIEQQARRGDALLADGRIRVACVDAGTFAPKRIPKALLKAA